MSFPVQIVGVEEGIEACACEGVVEMIDKLSLPRSRPLTSAELSTLQRCRLPFQMVGVERKACRRKKKRNDFNLYEVNNSLWDRSPHTLISVVQPFFCLT
jgi:hypothetical protein